MRFCRMSAVILAFAAIQSNGAVNVTASREYVDRKVTSVSNSIMVEVYTKDETDKKIVELAKEPGNYAAVSNAAMNALSLAGGTLTGDLAVGEDGTSQRKLTVSSAGGSAGITLQGGTSTGIGTEIGSSVTVGGSSIGGGKISIKGGGSYDGGEISIQGGETYGGRIHVGGSPSSGGAIEVGGTGASIKKDGKEVATEAFVDDKMSGVSGTLTTLTSAVNLKVDKTALDAHVADTNNPHGVTAEQTGALALDSGNTVGSSFSVDFPNETSLGGNLSFGIGSGPSGMSFVVNKLYCSSALGFYADGIVITNPEGTSGASVLGRIKEYGGDFKTARAEVDNLIAASAATKADKATTLAGYGITNAATEAYVDDKVRKAVLPTDPTFSNAVLSVGLNIDTNSVAVLNEIASTFGGFQIEGTATTVGGLLAALAAAVAWLRKKKIDKLTVTGMSKEVTANGGVAKLDDFFTESNSLLNGRLAYSRNATGLKDRAFNTLSFDGTEFNLSTALAAVTPTASGQPRDLLIVATATAATTISFTAGTIKGDKPTIDGSGTWLITLTEYESGVWYCRQIKMEDAA